MIRLLLIGFAVISINVFFQAVTSIYVSEKIISILNDSKKMLSNGKMLMILILSFFTFTILHVVHSLIWAVAFYMIPAIQGDFTNFAETLYFSIVTFTSLGYGDITLSNWRLLSGFEAINGIMLIGWTTAIMFTILQNLFKNYRKKE